LNTQPMHATSRGVTRNAAFNLIGHLIPAIVAFVAIRYLKEGLGDERIALLILVWSVLGYLALFDLGISRGVVRYSSEALIKNNISRFQSIFWTSNILLLAFGLVAAAILFLLTPWIVGSLLEISPGYLEETINSFYFSALSLPFLFATTGMRVVLEAQQRFGIINILRVPFSVANFIVPVGILFFFPRLDYVVGTLLALRILAYVAHLLVVLISVPSLRSCEGINRSVAVELISYGSWLTVGRIIAPIMIYLDKFVIGAIRPLSELPYYGIPFELIMRMFTLLQGMITVIFPAFSSLAATDPVRLKTVSLKSLKFALLLVVPIICGIVILGGPFLGVWMGGDYAENGTLVLQILAVSIGLVFAAHIPASVLLVVDRPDIIAKLNIIQLAFYFPALNYAVSNFGVVGAALLWFARTLIDVVVLSFFAHKLLPSGKSRQTKSLVFTIILSVINVVVAFTLFYFTSLLLASGASIALLAVSFAFAYQKFEDDEKNLIADVLLLKFLRQKEGK
jgi:O-antigen/teichoic acid export membrane protein